MKFLSLIITALVICFSGATHATAQRQTATQDLSNGFYLYDGQVRSVYTGGWRYVKKLYIQAQGDRTDATFEVIVNGDTKGTVYVPGRDPSYVVTVEESTESIEFRHIRGGTAVIYDVQAVMSSTAWPNLSYGSRYVQSSTITALARDVITLVESLRPYANQREYAKRLLPIKKIAARLYARAAGAGDFSYTVRRTLYSLKAQIDLAESYLDDTFERDAAFDMAVELLATRERIADMID